MYYSAFIIDQLVHNKSLNSKFFMNIFKKEKKYQNIPGIR